MTGGALVTAIIEILVSGFTGIASGVGTGLSTLASAIFFQTTTVGGVETTSLSVMGVLIVTFAAISLGLGLCRWVLNFLTSFGARNR